MEGLTQNEKIVWSYWETKTLREVVREVAAKGTHISLAHKFLQIKQSWDMSTTLEWFNAEVFAWVLQLLSRKQFFKASHVLTKMKITPHQHFLNVAKESLDKNLRDYILEQLIKNGDDVKKDLSDEWKSVITHWDLLKLLESSFEADGKRKQNKVFGVGRDLIVVTSSEIDGLTIQRIQTYSIEWKKTVASYLFLDIFNFSIVDFMETEFIWNISLQQNKAMFLKRWISVYYSKEKNPSNESLLSDVQLLKIDLNVEISVDMLKQLDTLFVTWVITEDMIKSVSTFDCYEYTKLCIYDTLCAFGYIFDNEKDNLNTILIRLSRSQNLSNMDKIFSRSASTLKRTDINNMLVNYCIKQCEYHTMTACVDYSLLPNLSENDYLTANCFDLWLLFKETANNKEIHQYIASIYETCKYVSGNNLEKYFSDNPILLLALIIFNGQESVFKIFNKNQSITLKNIKVNWENNFFNKLPHLYSVWQKRNNNLMVIENDVNVYQLLSGYKGLDTSKIFEFQLIEKSLKAKRKSTDPLQKAKNIDMQYTSKQIDYNDEIPHFSNKKLVRKYGYKKKLDYIYYLKQSRPCTASQALLVQQYQHFGRLSSKLINEACVYAHTTALQNWNDSVVSACCISFISMIGGDSIKCRTHLTCANLIAQFLEIHEGNGKEEVVKKIDKLMMHLITNEREAQLEMLDLVAKSSIMELTKIQNSQPFDVSKVLHEWQTVVRFAHFHNLTLPEFPLEILVKQNLWVMFLIFGDVFKYSQQIMLLLSKSFLSQPLVEHIHHSISYKQTYIMQHSSEGSRVFKSEYRKTSKESSDMNCTPLEDNFDFSLMGDIWEVMAICHGPEDPPGALLRASAALHCPLLALIATCYEPDAVDTCWAQWVLSSMNPEDLDGTPVKQWDLSGMQLSDSNVQKLMEICLDAGYYKTLYQSMTIFYKDSPICLLLKFILRTVLFFDFGPESVEILKSFNSSCGRRGSVIGKSEGSWLPRLQRPRFLSIPSISSSLITIALSKGLKSVSHQKAFLQCLCESEFSWDFKVLRPDFSELIELLNIATESNIPLDLERMCQNDAILYQKEYLDILIANQMFDYALRFAKVVKLPIEHILIADWSERYKSLNKPAENISQTSTDNISQLSCELSPLLFWTKSSLKFKEVNANPIIIIEFLKKQCDVIMDSSQKFYMLRLILFWFNKLTEDALTEMSLKMEAIEFEMWMAFLNSTEINQLQILSEEATYDYIMKKKSSAPFEKIKDTKIFAKLLNEIEQESNIKNMSTVGYKLNIKESEKWFHSINRLLECGLIEEAWRLSTMFSPSEEYSSHSLCSIELVRTCLRLVEGSITPKELPQSLKIIVTSSLRRLRSSDSQCSDVSFGEIVLAPEKQEFSTGNLTDLSEHCDVECISTLEALAARSGLKILKQVASIYRISQLIDWTYSKVLKYDGNPLDFINYVSGRGRMPLAKLVFITYELPIPKIVDYLCSEIVGAIISPHLTRTSGRKEHFRYTLWGYPLDSDFEMFLNLRPDDNSILGRAIIEHLMAFRKLYKTDGNVPESNADFTEIDDVEVTINEQDQNMDNFDNESEISHGSENSSLCADTFCSADNESIMSEATTSYYRKKEKKIQFDVISCTNFRIKSSVKTSMKLLLKGIKLSSKQVNVISIEFLVLAHECFSSVCDTEGIAIVLRSAQTLTSHLLAARSWRLMVHLLTGLARYTEMAYIFQMLKDNHQFEFLLGQFGYMLGQQQEKITSFKQGLLEFLKKNCPGDTELYCLVALHFSMYSEAADVKKKHANDLIITLIQMALDSMKALKKRLANQPEWIILTNNDSTRLLLDSAINHCSDSAEFYSKAGCLGAARDMAGLAQLLALQISLLANSPTKCILNLSREKMANLIDIHLSFMEGLIFAHAIDGGGGGWMSRWHDLVFQRVLRGGDTSFTKDIANFRPDIACYIIERLETEKISTPRITEVIFELRSYFK